jgi:flagellar basal-body rod protein FlgB
MRVTSPHAAAATARRSAHARAAKNCRSIAANPAPRVYFALGTLVAEWSASDTPSARMETTMDSILGVHGDALLFRAKRMEVLAANLANADTPRYLARDMEFGAVLRDVSGSFANASRLSVTNARHIEVAPLAAQSALKYRVPHQPSLDGNTVESELELARYAENAVSYQASLMFATGKISTLRSALAGVR